MTKIRQMIQGYPTQDGAGVKLVRVLGNATVSVFDPILMLDSFDSVNPKDYMAGFPMHPHRGIETITYVYHGKITHRDSLGHEDTISDGEVQWMTAGSGIMHEEKLPASDRVLGVQIWLNLPAKDKMVKPAYHSIKRDTINEIDVDAGKIRLLAGEYEGKKGFQSSHLPLDFYDLHIKPNQKITVPIKEKHSVLLFTLQGEAEIAGSWIAEKTAVKIGDITEVEIKTKDKDAQILWVSSIPLKEPVSWGGPIVMNTREELMHAFAELQTGQFLKSHIDYEEE